MILWSCAVFVRLLTFLFWAPIARITLPTSAKTMNNAEKLKNLQERVKFVKSKSKASTLCAPFRVTTCLPIEETKLYHVSHTNITIPYLRVPQFQSALVGIHKQLVGRLLIKN